MATLAEDLATLGRSLRQDLLASIDVETWQPLATAAALPALANLELETQAIAAFTADLTDLADWLTEGLSLAGASASVVEPMGQGDGEVGQGRSQTLTLPIRESIDSEFGRSNLGAAAGLASFQVEAAQVHCGEPSSLKSPETETAAGFLHNGPYGAAAPQLQPSTPSGQLHSARGNHPPPETWPKEAATASPAEFASDPLNSQPLAAGGGTQGWPQPKGTAGLADLAKQLAASGWPGAVAPAEESIEATEATVIQAASPPRETRFSKGLAPAIASPTPPSPPPSSQTLGDRGSLQTSPVPAEGNNSDLKPDLMDGAQPAGLLKPSRPEVNDRPLNSPPPLASNRFPASPPAWEVEPSALTVDQPRSPQPTANLPSEELQQLAAAQPSPRQGVTASRDRSRPNPLPSAWQSAPISEPTAMAGEALPRSRDAPFAPPRDRPSLSPPGELQTQSPAPPLSWANSPIDPDAPDFEDLMSAIAQTLTRDYHRFYGP